MTIDDHGGRSPSAWEAALQQLAAAGERMSAALVARGEPAGTTDAYLALLGATMETYLTYLSADVDFPTFLPCCGFFQHTGSPNPDTVYRRCVIDGAGTYRLTGERGSARQATIMAFGAPSATGMRTWPPLDLSDVTGPDGRFEVLVSPVRPPGHDGHWWRLDPEMASLWLRTTSDDWGNETDPRIAIARVDRCAARPRPSGEVVNAKMRSFATIIERSIQYGFTHTDQLIEGGWLNQLKAVDYSASGAMPLQWYYEGAFEVADGEGLLIEASMPDGCDYFSFSLTDRMLVTLDWVHAQTSLNRRQASIDPDGRVRFVVAGSDPGIRNWLDTTGYQRGVLQCRWIGSPLAPDVTASVVALASLAEVLPAGTAWVSEPERQQALDERRRGAQLRSLW